jgi:hypothetical protein
MNTYFSEELPKNCAIYLSGDDDIVNTTYVYNYLVHHPEESRAVCLVPGMKHGQLVFVKKIMDSIYKDIARLE